MSDFFEKINIIVNSYKFIIMYDTGELCVADCKVLCHTHGYLDFSAICIRSMRV